MSVATFEHLIRRISPTLKRITHCLNGHHSFFDDKDLYQEALIHLWLYHEDILSDKRIAISYRMLFSPEELFEKRYDKVHIPSINTGILEMTELNWKMTTIDGITTLIT